MLTTLASLRARAQQVWDKPCMTADVEDVLCVDSPS
jgi:hypothetical protein